MEVWICLMEWKCEEGERLARLKAPCCWILPQALLTEERNCEGVQKRKMDLKPIP